MITARAGEREFDAVVRFWFPKNGATSAKAFLQYACDNMEFLFLPQIPRMASRESVQDVKETVFSMLSSFSQLHAIVFQKGYCTSDEAELDAWYRIVVLSPALPAAPAWPGIDVENARWIYPAKMYAQVPPPLPPKHV